MTEPSFVHLHVHSNFSFKDATPHPQELVRAAAFYQMPALALTDHNTLAGAIRFYRAALEVGLKPIVGTEVELSSGHHLTLFAQNFEGYSNLCRLISALHLSQPGISNPLTTWDVLAPHSEGLICLSGCSHSRLSRDLLEGKSQEARNFLGKLADLFPGRCYVELENPLLPHTPKLLHLLAQEAKKLKLPLAASNNIHYLRPQDFKARDLLVCMGENISLRQGHPRRHQSAERYFKGPKSMAKLFADYPEALRNTLRIAELCNLELPLGQYHFPKFPLPQGQTAAGYLRLLCQKTLAKRYRQGNRGEARARLEHELGIIEQLGFCEYFLVVADIIKFAKKEGIRTAGRGSAADSLVAYLLGITHICPLEHNLLFERFLNPERQGMPDIDLDFDSGRRDEVLAYVYKKYSAACVAMVGTVNTISARSALREVAKAMDIGKKEVDRLARFLPRMRAHSIGQAIDSLPELKGVFPSREPWDSLLYFCRRLDKVPRHLSVHLGGVIISRQPLTDLVPLEWSAKGVVITQYDKDDVEYLGLVKMDLLGLRILSAIEEALQNLKQDGIELVLEELPVDDPATYALLRSTKTVGLFQLESPGMRELLGKLQPTCFDDIIANISLMRPGPMQADMVSPFIKRRHGLEPVTYAHPSLEPILKSTYGVIVYQEQVLEVASALAGFSLGQADLLRRFITHDRSQEEVGSLEEEFIAGALKRGVSEEVAARVFQQLAAFAAYGFNKAHAATFGLTGYYTAYLKAHYPAHFFTALLNHQPMGFYPPRVILHEARLLGIPIYPPDVNKSEAKFTLEKAGIRVGLAGLKGLNSKHIEDIVRARQKLAFTSLADFKQRVRLPPRALKNLIHIGALAAFGSLRELEQQAALLKSKTRSCPQGQSFLAIGAGGPKMEKPLSIKDKEALLWRELELTGLYISGHPLATFRPLLKYYEASTAKELRQCRHGQRVRVAGIIVSRQMPPTKSKQRIIFITIEDERGLMDISVLPQIQEQYARLALGCPLLLIEGKVRKTGPESISIRAERLFDLRRLGK